MAFDASKFSKKKNIAHVNLIYIYLLQLSSYFISAAAHQILRRTTTKRFMLNI